MINRHGPCAGITLFKLGRKKLELWFVPASYACPEHIHEDSSGEFFVIYGKGREIWRHIINKELHPQKQQYNLDERSYFKWLTVRIGILHGFSTGSTPMIFLTWQTWRKGAEVTSPATDFHITPSHY